MGKDKAKAAAAKARRAAASKKLEQLGASVAVDTAETPATGTEWVLPQATTELERAHEAHGAVPTDVASGAVADASPDSPRAAATDTEGVDKAPGEGNKARKRRERATVEELKLTTDFPELVELHDANAADPRFLVSVKAQRNTVQVPPHWWEKSVFLSNQTDRDQSDAVMPAFVASTGVAAMRGDPKLANPMALAKPFLAGHPRLPLTQYGDVYVQYKDMRARFNRFKPGVMSQRLRDALDMSERDPPPWIRGMQMVARLPPAYPGIRLPGINVPPPAGASWGLGKGQWGEPSRDKDGNFIFSGVNRHTKAGANDKTEKNLVLWGCDVSVCTQAPVGDDEPEETVARQPMAAAAPAQPAIPAFQRRTEAVPSGPGAPTQWATEMSRSGQGVAGGGAYATGERFEQAPAPGNYGRL